VTHEKRYVHHAYALVCHELHGIEYAKVNLRALCNRNFKRRKLMLLIAQYCATLDEEENDEESKR